MKDDFDNHLGLPEDELTGGSAMSDAGDLGIGGMDEEIEAEAPGRPSGGARARKSTGSATRKAAAPAKGTKRKGARAGAKKKGAKKKGARKSAGARKAARKGSARKSSKKAKRGSKKKSKSSRRR